MAYERNRRTPTGRNNRKPRAGYHSKSYRSGKSKISNRTAVIISICIAIITIIFGVAAGCIYFLNAGQDGTILENVSVAGVDVGGMTQAQAVDAVRAATTGTYSKNPMVVKVLDSKTEIPTSYVGTLDARAAVKAAYNFGNTGSQSKRQREQQIAMTTGYVVDLSPYLSMDESAIRKVLAELGTAYSSTLSQSRYEVIGTAPNQTLKIQLGVPEYSLDLEALYKQVLDAYSRNVFQVEGQCGMIAPDPIDLEAINNKYYVAPKNATFNMKTFEVIDGVDGYGFDVEAAKEKLEKAGYGTTVEIPFTSLAPEITAENLSTMLYRDELATYTAEYKSDRDRDTNLRLACNAINGTILYPGEVFSYNNALGERTAAKGYRPGPSYSGNQTVMTYGGGICQVTSALYYCTLVAELETVLRQNHSFAPAYVPLGMDATVSWGSIDFRFRNTSEYPIRIDAVATGGSVTVSIVGTDVKDYTVEMEYEIVSSEDYSVTYKTMSANNSEGYKNGDYIVEPYTGYKIKTYRVKKDKETQEVISRDYIDQSTYKKRDGVICKIEGASGGIGNGTVTDNGNGTLP